MENSQMDAKTPMLRQQQQTNPNVVTMPSTVRMTHPDRSIPELIWAWLMENLLLVLTIFEFASMFVLIVEI